jgi:hypothetical protein
LDAESNARVDQQQPNAVEQVKRSCRDQPDLEDPNNQQLLRPAERFCVLVGLGRSGCRVDTDRRAQYGDMGEQVPD